MRCLILVVLAIHVALVCGARVHLDIPVAEVPNESNGESHTAKLSGLGGGNTDEHGCMAAHNYTWCAVLDKCVQDYEGGHHGPCPVTPTPTPYHCPKDCSGNGKCVGPAQCACDPGFGGAACDKHCPNECSGNGRCGSDGKCQCIRGRYGPACDETRDCEGYPKQCNGAGRCVNHTCVCNYGYTGRTCSVHIFADCPRNMCHDRARFCVNNTCVCKEGFAGRSCERVVGCKEFDYCSGHGVCNDETHTCECTNGFEGQKCNHKTACPEFCHGHGHCNGAPNFNCSCFAGFVGATCDHIPRSPCPNSCTGHGRCDEQTQTCQCARGFAGRDCSRVELPSVCSKCVHGVCILGDSHTPASCQCHDGWAGERCNISVACSEFNFCSGRGQCVENNCQCFPGFSGDACERTDAAQCGPHFCSGHGRCKTTYQLNDKRTDLVLREAVCECHPGFTGSDCSHFTCAGVGCIHGVCELSNETGALACTCDRGFIGADCGEAVICPGSPPCNGKGECNPDGTCQCSDGFSGEDCSTAPPSQSAGPSPAAVIPIGASPSQTPAPSTECCPSNCSQNGACNMVACRCECYADWQGAACDIFTS